LKFTPF